MFDSQLQFERLEQIPDQYRRNAARYHQMKVARSGATQSSSTRLGTTHPLRRRFAAILRRVADAVEPASNRPPLNV